jgi:tryptophan-rich sensory protein
MKSPQTRGSLGILGLLILLTLGIGWLGSRATLPEITGWYANLIKPSFNPPNYLFGPVWSTLYLLMAVSQWMVWKSSQNKLTKIFFFLMLVSNALWSPVFFKYHQIGWALVVLAFYLITLGAWVRRLYQENKTAAYLQSPHLLWVSFATILNASIYLLNR